MAEPRAKGAPISGTPTLDDIVGVLRSGLGDAHIQDRGLGHGTYADGKNVGSLDAVYAMKNLTAAGEIEIPHALGRVPQWAKLWEITEGTDAAAHVIVRSCNKSTWTRSTIRVRVQLISGSLSGMTVTFMVGGG